MQHLYPQKPCLCHRDGMAGWQDDIRNLVTGKTTASELFTAAKNKIERTVGNLSDAAIAGLRNKFRATVAQQLGKKPEDVTDAEILSFIASLPTQQIAQAVKEAAPAATEDIGNKILLGFGALALVLFLTRK